MSFRIIVNTAFVVSRKIANTNIGKKVFKAFSEQVFPVLEAAIHQRVIYAESAAMGKTVFEVDGARNAQLEISRLCRELQKNQERVAV